MSFGFSVGDFIGAANLTYKLIAALRENHGAGEDFRAAIDELGCYQAALMRVSYLERNKNIPRDTFDAASHMVMQSMEMIQDYLDQTKKYDQKLGRLESSGFKYGVRKVRWTLLKAEDMRKLRENLQRRNAALQLLLQCAGLETVDTSSKYTNDEKDLENTPIVGTKADLHRKGIQTSVVQTPSNDSRSQAVIEITEPSPEPGSVSSQLFSLSSFSAEQLRTLISNRTSREAEIRTLGSLLRTMVRLGDYQLSKDDSATFVDLLDVICRPAEEQELQGSSSSKAPIKLKDAVGRKFSFPWSLCKSWQGMEGLIKQAFLHVDVIGPHVHQGHYDLVSPDGEIVLPQVWDTIIKPGMAITMHMWPMPEPPPAHADTPRTMPPPSPDSATTMPIRSRGAHKATRGDFFPWAVGGSPSSGPRRNNQRGDARVGVVTDRESGNLNSATLNDQQSIASARKTSGSSSPQFSSQTSSPHSTIRSHAPDYDSDISSLQSTSIVADANFVPDPDELFDKLGTARLSSAFDDDDGCDGKLFPNPCTGKVGLEEV